MTIWSITFAFLLALAVSALATPIVARLAISLGAIDRPDARKVNLRPNIPLLGGISVALGFFVGLAAAILEGVHLVEMKLRRALEQSGLKPIEAVGQKFNPELHDAMVTVPTAFPEEDEIVAQELAKGYMFKDRLLRPSLGQVKMYQPEAEGGDPGGAEDGS